MDSILPHHKGGKTSLCGGAGDVQLIQMQLQGDECTCKADECYFQMTYYFIQLIQLEDSGESKCALLLNKCMNLQLGSMTVAVTGSAQAEYLRGDQDGMFFADKIFRLAHADSEESSLLGCIPSVVDINVH